MSFYEYLKLREASQEDIEKINPKRNLHFGNIFGNRLRVVVPLDSGEEMEELAEKLRDLGYEVKYSDLVEKKVAYKKIQTRQGEKLRPEKIGKILQANGLSDLLDWWQKNGENLKNNDVGASIVISRSPIDVLRMSDHDGISSCHSPDGSFYKCARQEARTGGAIAYVVKNSDLKKVNIQDDEIFEDPDRGVDGIVPLERLRLRRLTNGKLDLLMPELRTYGVRNVGFLDAVKSWAKTAQHDVVSQIKPDEDFKSFKLKGGSYQDTGADKVWSDFFGASVSGNKRSQDEDEEDQDETGNVYERADETLENHRRNWKHVDVYLDESDGYLSYSASSGFSIPRKMFILSRTEILEKRTWMKLKRVIEDAIDVAGLENLEINEDGDVYNITFSVEDRDGYGYDQLTNFEHFLDEIDEFDRDFNDHVGKVYKALLEEGFIKDFSSKIEFKNFDVELDDDFVVSTKEAEKIGYLKDYSISKNNLRASTEIKVWAWNKEFPSWINKFNVLPFKVDESNFRLLMKPGETRGAYFGPSTAYNVDSNDPNNLTKLTGWVYFHLTISLDLNLYKNSDVVKRIKNLDNNWDFYVKKLAILFDKFIKNNQSRSPAALVGAAVPIDRKELSSKPRFKASNQMGLNFKEWIRSF